MIDGGRSATVWTNWPDGPLRECLRTCPLLNGLGLNGRSIPFGMGTASGSFEPLAIFPTGDYGHDLAG